MMLRIRKWLLAVLLIVGGGSLSATLTYGLYLHSDAYRHKVENRISDFLQLPFEFDKLQPLSRRARALYELRAYLPDRSDHILQCKRALWQEQYDEGDLGYVLELVDGQVSVGTTAWRKEDYRRVLEAGLAHDFNALNLRRVMLTHMDVIVARPQWTLTVSDASGSVVFDPDQPLARATLESESINGHKVPYPIRCSARFIPGTPLIFEHTELVVPRMPVRFLNLDSLLGSSVTAGLFTGRILYEESGTPNIRVSGYADKISLAELSVCLQQGSFAGRIERFTIHDSRFAEGKLVDMSFSGSLAGLKLEDFAGRTNTPGLAGTLNLQVDRGMIAGGQLAELRAQGVVRGMDLESISTRLGIGRITGHLEIVLHHLRIEGGRIQSAEIDAFVNDSGDTPLLIDHTLIQYGAQHLLEDPIPQLPLQELEYAHLGIKLIIKDKRLRIQGLYGDGHQVVLSIQLLGQEIPLLRAPDQEFETGDLIALLQETMGDYDLAAWFVPSATIKP